MSFLFSQSLLFAPNYINVLGENQLLWEPFYPTNEKRHTIIAECQIVSIHRKSYLQRFLQTLPFRAKKRSRTFTPLQGKKKIPNLFWCEISVKAYSVFFRQTGIFLFSRRFTVFICTYITPGMSACHDDFATGVFICVHLHDLRI